MLRVGRSKGPSVPGLEDVPSLEMEESMCDVPCKEVASDGQ